jgi:hypothetical protein
MAVATKTKVICERCGKELAASSLRKHNAKHERDDERERLRDASGFAGDVDSPPADVAGGGYAGEELTPGAKSKKSWRERLWAGRDDSAGARKEPVSPRHREKRPAGKRAPADEVLGLAYMGAGVALEKSGADVPVGRLMQMMSPVAGQVLDRAAADTAFDRAVLQRLAGAEMQNAEDVAMIIGTPILVSLAWRNPEFAMALEAPIKFMLRRMMVGIVEVEKRRAAEAEKYAAALAELDMPAGVDPVEGIWQMLFATDEEPAPAPSPAEANGSN